MYFLVCGEVERGHHCRSGSGGTPGGDEADLPPHQCSLLLPRQQGNIQECKIGIQSGLESGLRVRIWIF